MAKAKTSRKQLFRAALAMAGITAEQWAEGEAYSAEHVSRVLNQRISGGAVLDALIDAFIKKHMSGLTAIAS